MWAPGGTRDVLNSGSSVGGSGGYWAGVLWGLAPIEPQSDDIYDIYNIYNNIIIIITAINIQIIIYYIKKYIKYYNI